MAQYSSSNRDVFVPNTGTWPGSGVTLNGTRIQVQGLVGVGRISGGAKDPATGESLGSVSDLQISAFVNNGNGSYSGTFNFLPDRGFNSGAIFSNYAARINQVDFNFTPYTSNVPTALQNQIQMTFMGSTRFTYDHDGSPATAPVFTTGLLPNPTVTTSLFGQPVPTTPGSTIQSDGSVTNRLTVDAEGLILDSRPGKQGSGWVSDEYGANIYHFNSAKQIDGVLGIPQALVPHKPAGTVNFNGTPVDGRRDNQGFEGIALSPDGTKLYALLQSATLQDSGTGNQGRANAVRMLEYDVSSTDSPTDPIAQYVIQLPRIDDNGGTPAVNRAGAQSALEMINDHQILILSRDGNGRGASGAPVFKSVLLADLNGATDIDGSYDNAGSAVAPGGALNAGVTPIAWIEAVNMLGKVDLGITELEQFGFNLNAAPGDINTLSEKWEAMGLVSALDAAHVNDYFLFIGNDNDFLTQSGLYMDEHGVLQPYDAGLENDTVVLAYRITATPEPTSLLAGVALLASCLIGTRLRRSAS
ncbi:MAG: esterase-like activity of phytase family protein [Planctomycetales bacterium]